FGVRAKVTHVARGPAITRYEIYPPPGIKVSRIVGLADDIALSMASPDVRIEAPIPGKAAVGIEVPNVEITMVHLRELLESEEFRDATSRLTVSLGKDIAGHAIVADLSRMPHLLIAGATGSGKSVCLNTMIASILFKAIPDHVKFLIIDPKMVELTTYNGIPHLISPVVTDPKKAATALRWAVKEMEYRYELFAAAAVRDITRYNSAAGRKDASGPPLPFIVVIIDELADLMMVAPADVEDSICRLAQMARAAGIHLVIATQRPSVDVITGLIKANIPSRISFAVSSQVDSRTVLDMGGAEKLLGKGDMLFFPVGASKPIRVQGAYLSDREVENLVTFWKKQAEPVYDESVAGDFQRVNSGEIADDELLPRAVEIFIETGHASISMLQRRLHIGYARAARLIDIMERKGIVGGYEGSKPRSVLMTLEQYETAFRDKGKKIF
ncbi:MAG: DNA translocase FtsK, partial [Desulfocucumaceae bacterium]